MTDQRRDLSRLLQPRSIAVIGGGAWGAQVVQQAQRMGFDGAIWPVHPTAQEVAGMPTYVSLSDLPDVPDAVFVGVNRHVTVNIVAELAAMRAGGAVCFASGFSEAVGEDPGSGALQADLISAAGDMPILGPNCYGFINALDGALVWPDQHGCQRQDSGVAILTQSSNIAINLTMQKRALPIAYMVACGNMAQTNQAEIALALLDDPRVTAIGLHIEGFGPLAPWENLAQKAAARDIPLIALKMGRSAQARQATISHTASLAGSDAGAQAVLDRLGIARIDDVPTFVETLKLAHTYGYLESNRLAVISCSGGEASLAADTAHGRQIVLPPLNPRQETVLRKVLGPMVALANPLDYHTYIWRDAQAMTKAWAAMCDPEIALTLSVVDYPHTDARDWDGATQAAIGAHRDTGRPMAVVATLSELMPEDVAATLSAVGVVPMMGLTEAMAAFAALQRRPLASAPMLPPGPERDGELISEAEAKEALASFGVAVPNGDTAQTPEALARLAMMMPEPMVLKAMGVAHKSDSGAVRLGLRAAQVQDAATEMQTKDYLLEEMVQGGVAELLIGVTRDPAHGFVLTLGAGGTLTELLADATSLMVPADEAAIRAALRKLRLFPLLTGYRGKPGADLAAICAAVQALQDYVVAHADTVLEVEINPLICTPTRAVAADALIRKAR